MRMHRLAWLTSLVLASSALADEEAVDYRTPTEAGTLSRMGVAVEVGMGAAASSPPLFGGRLTLGLGGVDLSAGAGVFPPICIFDSCDAAFVILGGGAQARLWRSADHLTTLGARVSFESDLLAEHQWQLFLGGLQLATGTRIHRLSIEAVALEFSSHGGSDDGVHVGARVAYTALGKALGFQVSAGAAINVAGDRKSWFPLFGLSLIFR